MITTGMQTKQKNLFYLQLKPTQKRVATDYIGIEVKTDDLIGEVKQVENNREASVSWNGLEKNKNYYWYVQVADAFGGATESDIWDSRRVRFRWKWTSRTDCP